MFIIYVLGIGKRLRVDSIVAVSRFFYILLHHLDHDEFILYSIIFWEKRVDLNAFIDHLFFIQLSVRENMAVVNNEMFCFCDDRGPRKPVTWGCSAKDRFFRCADSLFLIWGVASWWEKCFPEKRWIALRDMDGTWWILSITR